MVAHGKERYLCVCVVGNKKVEGRRATNKVL